MQLAGAVVVVTGAASGIGAALCERFATEASAVVAVDLDAGAAGNVAQRIETNAGRAGLEVWSAGCDVAHPDEVARVVGSVLERHGRVDLYCSNAGIASGAGIEASDELWERVWAVNVMAHVHALRALSDHWTERGDGHLLVTASAAGLLTNLGDAPYSVSKHGAVALAEWVSITYGDRGIGVSCLCPQGVRTPLLFGRDGEPIEGSLAAEVVKAQRILEPDEVARVTADALAADRFLILPHEEVATYERARAGDRERWLASMRRLQARLHGG